MSNPLPSDLSLVAIANGDVADATPVESNFASIQNAVNELVQALSGGTLGQALLAADGSHVEWGQSPGSEIGYDQITANVSVTGTSAGTSTTIISAAPHIFDGTPVIAEFFSPLVSLPQVAGGGMQIALYEGVTQIAILAAPFNPSAATGGQPVLARLRFTPLVGSNTYTIKAWVTSTTGSPNVNAGTGNSSIAPAYLRFTKV